MSYESYDLSVPITPDLLAKYHAIDTSAEGYDPGTDYIRYHVNSYAEAVAEDVVDALNMHFEPVPISHVWVYEEHVEVHLITGQVIRFPTSCLLLPREEAVERAVPAHNQIRREEEAASLRQRIASLEHDLSSIPQRLAWLREELARLEAP